MDTATIQTLCDRLSTASDVDGKLPWSLRSKQDGATQDEKRAHLQALLERDAALFLEKYGASLSSEELSRFEVFKGDYEVNWHLNRLNDSLSPSPQQEKARAALVKNRRLACMQRLEDEGTYFSEDAMRERAPLLHEQFMGQQPTAPVTGGRQPVVPRPGEGLSELILRQAKEDFIAARLKQERDDFAKQAATVEEEDAAPKEATPRFDQEELEEETPVAQAARERSKEPVEVPGLEPSPTGRTNTTTKARGVGGPKKPRRMRFGTISGVSVAGTPPAVQSALQTGPTVNADSGEGLSGGRGKTTDGSVGMDQSTSLPASTAEVKPGDTPETSEEQSQAVASLFGPFGKSRNGADVSNGESRVNGHGANGYSANGHSANGHVGSGNGHSVVEGEERVSHARFGEFTTPEPVSASRIASQVVRSVLESAGAGAGARQPVTRYGEIRDATFGGGSRASDHASPNVQGMSDRGMGIGDGGRGIGSRGAHQLSTLEQNTEAAAEAPRDAEGRNSTAVGSTSAAGIGDGARTIGDGARTIGDGGDEEMDTDEEDLGSRTHTGVSELAGDTVDVDSGPKGQINELRRVMRERFLEGEDGEHVDYRAIDSDAKLDDDWLGQVDRDAQEKYFDED